MFEQADLLDLAEAADQIRIRRHPDNVISYIIDRNINYTNVCKEFCTFCAFYRVKGRRRGLRPARSRHLQEDRRNARSRWHRNPDAGRSSPGSQDRLLRETAVRNQGALPDSLPLLFAVRDSQYRQGVTADGRRNFRTPESRRPGLHARRGWRDSGRRSSHRHQSAQVHERRMADGSPRSSQARSPHHRAR